MCDLIERARERAGQLEVSWRYRPDTADLIRELAAEVERLRAERDAASQRSDHAEARAERLREAVEQLRGMLALSRRPAAPAPTAVAAGASTSQVVYPSPPAPPAPAAAAEDVAAVQGVIDARGNPAAQHAWERLRAAIEASPPGAPATCPECGGCAVCLGEGVLRRYEPGSGIGEAVPCPRCRAGEFPATRRGRESARSAQPEQKA